MVKSPLYWCSNSRKESDVIQQQREQRGDEGEQIWNKEPDKKKLGLAVGIRNLVRSSGSWNHRTNGRDRWRINSSQLRWRLWGSWKLRKTWDSLYEESRARRNNIEAEASTSFWDKNWLDWARARGSCFLNLRGRGSISTYRNILLQEQQASQCSRLSTLLGYQATLARHELHLPPCKGNTADHDCTLMLSGIL